MNGDPITAYGTLLMTFFAAAGFIAGFIYYRRQCNVQVFLEYTKRYADVMNMFPSDGRSARIDLFKEPPPEIEELTLAVMRYLNLCSEEFYLWKNKYLSNGVWRIWEDELKRTLRSPLLRREWNKVRKEFESYPDFCKYVNDAQG
jgi:hypothetical protein